MGILIRGQQYLNARASRNLIVDKSNWWWATGNTFSQLDVFPSTALMITCLFLLSIGSRASSNFLQSCTLWWSLILAESLLSQPCVPAQRTRPLPWWIVLSSLFLQLIRNVKLCWLYWLLHSQYSLACRQGEQDLLLLERCILWTLWARILVNGVPQWCKGISTIRDHIYSRQINGPLFSYSWYSNDSMRGCIVVYKSST